ncbi:unnamed protein product [Lampetra planeri]
MSNSVPLTLALPPASVSFPFPPFASEELCFPDLATNSGGTREITFRLACPPPDAANLCEPDVCWMASDPLVRRDWDLCSRWLLPWVPLTLSLRLSSGSFFIFMEIFLTVRGDLILSGKDQLIELLFFAGFGLEGGEKPTVLGRHSYSAETLPTERQLIPDSLQPQRRENPEERSPREETHRRAPEERSPNKY